MIYPDLATTPLTTVSNYLSAEAQATDKHEYLEGFVYPLHYHPITNMAGASDAHVKVAGNAHYALKTHLRGTACSLYMADMRLNIKTRHSECYFYPDVLVTCDPQDRERTLHKESPILVIEVLSPSTEDYDRGKKFAMYRLLPSLREYVLIDPTQYLVEIYRINEHQRWELFNIEGENSTVEFVSIGLSVPLRDLYEDVRFG